MKKGRHRRFEEARALKEKTLQAAGEKCAECGADADGEHAAWCRATEDDFVEDGEDED